MNNSDDESTCDRASQEARATQLSVDETTLELAAGIFRALGDVRRLRLAARLTHGDASVSQLAEEEQNSMSTISQRLKVLRAEGLLRRRREGKRVIYSLASPQLGNLVVDTLAYFCGGELDNHLKARRSR